MSTVAYALREEYAGEVEVETESGKQKVPVYDGGQIALVDGATFDVGEQLRKGKGAIVLRESEIPLIDRLDAYPALKRVAAPKGAKPISTYGYQSQAVLADQASTRGIEGASSLSKAELVKALERQDEAVASGDQEVADNPSAQSAGQEG